LANDGLAQDYVMQINTRFQGERGDVLYTYLDDPRLTALLADVKPATVIMDLPNFVAAHTTYGRMLNQTIPRAFGYPDVPRFVACRSNRLDLVYLALKQHDTERPVNRWIVMAGSGHSLVVQRFAKRALAYNYTGTQAEPFWRIVPAMSGMPEGSPVLLLPCSDPHIARAVARSYFRPVCVTDDGNVVHQIMKQVGGVWAEYVLEPAAQVCESV
jgi:hypothetical protein